jgi:hypothetical protein
VIRLHTRLFPSKGKHARKPRLDETLVDMRVVRDRKFIIR